MTKKSNAWVEKYRPQKLEDYIFHDKSQQDYFKTRLADGDIPHLLLSGVQGSGKTALSGVIVNELGIDDTDVMRINCSDEMVDAIREKVKNFAGTYSFSKFKVVQLEEMDYLSLNGQALLRNVMEEYYDNCRFIGTCNYEHKVIPALKSRMTQFHFKAPVKEEVLMKAGEILALEDVEFDLETLEKFVDAAYPDIRKVINLLQSSVKNGKLQAKTEESNDGDYRFQVIDLLAAGDLHGVRKCVCENAAKEEYEEIYTFMYRNIDKVPKFKDVNKFEMGIVKIAEYLYKNSLVADQEINFAALCIELNLL